MEATKKNETKLSIYIDNTKIIIYSHTWWGYKILKEYEYSKKNIINALNYFLKKERQRENVNKQKDVL